MEAEGVVLEDVEDGDVLGEVVGGEVGMTAAMAAGSHILE
jgi:hypothetical protein